jgi:hypothetical protein
MCQHCSQRTQNINANNQSTKSVFIWLKKRPIYKLSGTWYNQDMNWVIGDIHGMFDALQALLARIKVIDPTPSLFCTGDLCDRVPDTKNVVDLVIREKIKTVLGNHDDNLSCILRGEPTPYTVNPSELSPLNAIKNFWTNGIVDTFASYGKKRNEVVDAL